MDKLGVLWKGGFLFLLVAVVVLGGFLFHETKKVSAVEDLPAGEICSSHSECASQHCGCTNAQNETVCCEDAIGKSCTSGADCPDHCANLGREGGGKAGPLTAPVTVICNPFTGKCEGQQQEPCYDRCMNSVNLSVMACDVDEGVASCATSMALTWNCILLEGPYHTCQTNSSGGHDYCAEVAEE